jgi:hypothetical protein
MSNPALDDQYTQLREDLLDFLIAGGRLAVIKAPPGSGKTYTLVEVLSSLVREGSRIALGCQTNSQADDVCNRLAGKGAATVRFSSSTYRTPDDLDPRVVIIRDRKQLPAGPAIAVGTIAKWALTDIVDPFDLFAVDEAWQMSWADLMQCALLSERFLLIGDPGQIPPVVTVDARRWDTSPRAPHLAAPNVVVDEPALAGARFLGELPACRRLPHEAVDFVKPFYDFDFAAYADPAARGIDLPNAHRFANLADGRPLALTLPTPPNGPPVEVDHDIAASAATVVGSILDAAATLRVDGRTRPLLASDIGISSTHRVMNAALSSALAPWSPGLRVDTPERWQGLERPLMIAVHPLSGVTDPSAFDLETGRLCVMASRQQAGFILLTRDHVGDTLANYVPSAEQAPGRPDIVGRGHDSHLRFWRALVDQGRVGSLS